LNLKKYSGIFDFIPLKIFSQLKAVEVALKMKEIFK
jgi:hypothetical protein